MTESRNLVPKIGLVLVMLFFAYCWAAVGGYGSFAGGPIEVLGVLGTILLYSTILVTFATIYIGARRAHRSGRWLWFFGVIFIWPVSYLYTLVVNRDG